MTLKLDGLFGSQAGIDRLHHSFTIGIQRRSQSRAHARIAPARARERRFI